MEKIKKDNEKKVQKEHKIKKSSSIDAGAPFAFEKINENIELQQINIEEALSNVNDKKIISESEKEHLDEAQNVVSNQKSKKKKISSLIFLIINIVIVLIILLTQISSNNVIPLSDVIKSGFNGWFFLLCLVFFMIISFFEGIKINLLVKSSGNKSRPFLSFKTAALGRYYDCVTPLATGGQPFQIFFLKSRGLKASDAISVPLGKYVAYQITYSVFITIIILSTIFAPVGNGVEGTVVSAAGWIGYLLNIGMISIILILAVNRRVGNKIVTGILKLLKKIKLVKNYDKAYGSVIKTVDDFQTTIKAQAKKPKTLVLSILYNVITILINYTIPFFIYCTFAGFNGAMWSEIFIKCAIIDIAASFIPLPGGTGVAELSFTALFASLFTGGTLFWALIIWRLMSYYGYIIQGLLVILYEYIIGDKKYQWLSKKWKLEAESEKFKTEQLSYFKQKTRKNKKNI